ncbi:MAG: hypothetical protein PVI03_04180 [Candidatus Thorarchaeota archaeon]|jgi:hypothetical protein
MAYEPVPKKEMDKIKKDMTIIEPEFHQVTELGGVTLVVSSHINEEKFPFTDYVNVYAKEKTRKIDHSVDVAEWIASEFGVDPNGFMIIVDITKDKKIASMEIIRM